MENSEEAPAAPAPATEAGQLAPEQATGEASAPSPAAEAVKVPSPVADPPAASTTAASTVTRAAASCSAPPSYASSPLLSTKSEKFNVHELPRSHHIFAHLTSPQSIAEHQRWNARSLVRKQEDLLHSLSRIRANLERADIEFENALKLAAPTTYRESDPTGLRKVARAAAREHRENDRREGSRERRTPFSEEREAIACSDGGTVSEPVDEEGKCASDEIGKLRSKIDNLLAKTSYESDYSAVGSLDKLGGDYLPRYSSVPPISRVGYEVDYGFGSSWEAPVRNQYLQSYEPYTNFTTPKLADFALPPTDI